MSDLESEVRSRVKFEVSVEWRVWRFWSSEVSVWRVDWRAAFWDERAGKALVD